MLSRSPALLDPQWPGLYSLPRGFRPIVVLSQPSTLISILTPITDSMSLCDPIGAPLSCKKVTMETKNNSDPLHCCSPPANSSLNRGFGRNYLCNRLQDKFWPLCCSVPDYTGIAIMYLSAAVVVDWNKMGKKGITVLHCLGVCLLNHMLNIL